MSPMRVEEWRTWLCFSFDDRCKLTDRAVRFGTLQEASADLYQSSFGHRPFDIAATVMVAPIVGPSDLREIICAVASIKLPYQLASALTPQERALWHAREPGA